MTALGPLVMVVDDDEDIREMLKFFLEGEGYRVAAAASGRDAWRQLKTRERPSLILLDLMMPVMDGEAFLKMLRASPLAGIPVVIMSGHKLASGNTGRLKEDYCLLKPVEFDELLEVVRRFSQREAA
jgi:CheY-like chemotaxis protein